MSVFNGQQDRVAEVIDTWPKGPKGVLLRVSSATEHQRKYQSITAFLLAPPPSLLCVKDGGYRWLLRTFTMLLIGGLKLQSLETMMLNFSSHGITKDERQGMKWMKLSAAKGNMQAINVLSLISNSSTARMTSDWKKFVCYLFVCVKRWTRTIKNGC